MINLDNLAVIHNPCYYRLKTAVLIPPELGGTPNSATYIVEFDAADLCDPTAEPIGVRGDGKGNRIYQFRDQLWYEYDVSGWYTRILMERNDAVGECVRAMADFNHALYRGNTTSVWRVLYKAANTK